MVSVALAKELFDHFGLNFQITVFRHASRLCEFLLEAMELVVRVGKLMLEVCDFLVMDRVYLLFLAEAVVADEILHLRDQALRELFERPCILVCAGQAPAMLAGKRAY